MLSKPNYEHYALAENLRSIPANTNSASANKNYRGTLDNSSHCSHRRQHPNVSRRSVLHTTTVNIIFHNSRQCSQGMDITVAEEWNRPIAIQKPFQLRN